MKNQKVLITGATGFIGGHILRKGLSLGYECVALIRNPDQSLSSCLGAGNTIIGPLEETIKQSSHYNNVAAVIHCAARVHQMRETANDPLAEYRKINRDLTVDLARNALNAGVERFIFLSTIKVMGDEGDIGALITENDPPKPSDPYGQSKMEAEQCLHALFQNQSIGKCTIIRLPMVYGEGNKGNMLGLLKAASGKIPLPLKAANGKRSMIYVGNIADAILRIVSCAPSNSKSIETYFLTDGVDYSSAELYSAIYRVMNGGKSGLLYVPSVFFKIPALFNKRIKGIVSRLFDGYSCSTGLFQKTYSWQPPFTLEDGVKRLVEWYNSGRNTLYAKTNL